MSGNSTMRAWRTHEYGATDRGAAARHRSDPRARRGRVARPGAGDPVQPQRSRTHHRRQHDGAARAAVQPGHGSHGRRRRVRCGHRAVAGASASSRCRKARNGGFAEYAICPVVSTFEMPATIPLPDAAALYFPFHLAWLGLFDRADAASRRERAHPRRGRRIGLGRDPARQARAARACSPPREPTTKVTLCRELGADVAINYDERRLRRSRARRDGNRRRRRRVRQRRRSGDRAVDEVHRRTTAAT